MSKSPKTNGSLSVAGLNLFCANKHLVYAGKFHKGGSQGRLFKDFKQNSVWFPDQELAQELEKLKNPARGE